MTFSTYSVNYLKRENRLQLTFILLLTTVTFKFAVNSSLPRISYFTTLVKLFTQLIHEDCQSLLCSRPIDRIARLARPSDCPSVCLYGLVTKKNTKKRRKKSKLVCTFSKARVSGVPVFSLKGQRSRSQNIKPPKSGVLFNYWRQRRWIKHKLGLCSSLGCMFTWPSSGLVDVRFAAL